MAMTATPVFVQTPKQWFAQVSTANTNRDGTGTLVDIVSGATNGTKIDCIYIQAAGTVTAGVVRLYVNDGTNTRLWKEVMVTATTPSTSVQAWNSTIDLSYPGGGMFIPNGYKLRASTHNSETFNIIAVGGDF